MILLLQLNFWAKKPYDMYQHLFMLGSISEITYTLIWLFSFISGSGRHPTVSSGLHVLRLKFSYQIWFSEPKIHIIWYASCFFFLYVRTLYLDQDGLLQSSGAKIKNFMSELNYWAEITYTLICIINKRTLLLDQDGLQQPPGCQN